MRRSPAKVPQSRSGTALHRTKRRDYVLPFLAAGLVLLGSFRMADFADLDVAGNVSKFQISFGFMALGYVLAWKFAKRLMWFMLLIAAICRIALLPVGPGDALERHMWDGRVFAADFNPYSLSPDAPELQAYRDASWEGMVNRDSTSRYMPASLWAYGFFEEISGSAGWVKGFLVFADLMLCVVFALRFGADRAVLYAWNPLVCYAVAGLGVDLSFCLLPFIGGYFIWEYWIDQKGGVAGIKASGGIGSGLGQIVCVGAFLMGVGAMFNLLLAPALLWLVWHVLKRSGFQAGLATGVFAFAPLVLSLMWASISMDLELAAIVPAEFAVTERGVGLFPQIFGFVLGGFASPGLFLGLLLVISVWMVHTCENLGRFLGFYLIWVLALGTSIYPWSFILLATVGLASGNYVFRVGSLAAFAYFGAYHGLATSGFWSVPWSMQVLLWIPFLIAAGHFAVSSRTKQGFYVHQF